MMKREICMRTIQLKFKGYSKKQQFRMPPHTKRHTFAAHLAQKGMKLECIQELLGQESPQQTRLYAMLYDHARKEMYDEWM
jgi:site-specific recombinase XerD